MISDFLISKLKESFPDRPFAQKSNPTKPVIGYSVEPVVSYPSVDDEVGELNIYDDGDEARVEVGKISHGHFGCYDETLSELERHKDIAETVVNFVKNVFEEKVIFFSSLDGRVGGWQMLKPDGTRHSKKPLTKYYVWSGPLND